MVVSPQLLNFFTGAFESYILINKNNGEGRSLTRSKLSTKVKNAVAIGDNMRTSQNLLNHLLENTPIELNAQVEAPVEDWGRRWTTFSNLNIWFDFWERTIFEVGFAHIYNGVNLTILENQLRIIIKIYGSCLSLDGRYTTRGGLPCIVFYDPNLSNLGKYVTKSRNTATFIAGSSAYEESFPPHLILFTKGKETRLTDNYI